MSALRKNLPTRDKIMAIERAALEMTEHHVEIKTTHHFASGVYAREIFIPAGCTVVGKIHKTEHLNIVSAGAVAVASPGAVTRIVRAPCTFVAPPGSKRVLHAVEDTVWTNVHAVGEMTDLDEIEAHFIAPDFDALECDVWPG